MWLEEIKKQSGRSINICCYESETPSVLYFWFSFPKTCTVLRRISKEIGFKSCLDPYNKLEGEETWIGTDSPWLPYHSAWCQTDVQLGSYAPQKTESPWIPGWCWSLVALPLPPSSISPNSLTLCPCSRPPSSPPHRGPLTGNLVPRMWNLRQCCPALLPPTSTADG